MCETKSVNTWYKKFCNPQEKHTETTLQNYFQGLKIILFGVFICFYLYVSGCFFRGIRMFCPLLIMLKKLKNYGGNLYANRFFSIFDDGNIYLI